MIQSHSSTGLPGDEAPGVPQILLPQQRRATGHSGTVQESRCCPGIMKTTCSFAPFG